MLRINLIKFYAVLKDAGIKYALLKTWQYLGRNLGLSRLSLKKSSSPVIDYNDLRAEDYLDYADNTKLDALIKVIAFYLPQFHPFPENDQFWGKGFTEWANVTKAKPNFNGHYQPHLPTHLGFYDLRLIENLRQQAALARNYGIEGFCFYYYWFSGKQVMNLPIENLYNHKDIDINYCVCWANENWTRTWDGQSHNVLLAQKYLPSDPLAFILDIGKYFQDERYIKVDGKPVLIVYNPLEINQFNEYIKIWRSEVIKMGFPGLYLLCTKTTGYSEPKHDIDALVEFPPHQYAIKDYINSKLEIYNPNYSGWVFDYNDYADLALKKDADYKLIRSVMLSWDNTARRQNTSITYHNFTIDKFAKLLSERLHTTLSNDKLSLAEKFVFINAWNEWAEGTHLEPDRKHGFAYLNAVYQGLKPLVKDNSKYLIKTQYRKGHAIAVIFHLYYIDALDEFFSKTKAYHDKADFYFTITDQIFTNALVQRIHANIPDARILIGENRGRDILPFIKMFRLIQPLNYTYVCKVHSKPSLQSKNGKSRYSNLLNNLFSLDLTKIKDSLDQQHGLLIPKDYALKLNATWQGKSIYAGNEKNIQYFCRALNLKLDLDTYFPAETMFWFAPAALSGMETIALNEFCYENGAINGEKIHAVARIFGLICLKNKYKVALLS